MKKKHKISFTTFVQEVQSASKLYPILNTSIITLGYMGWLYYCYICAQMRIVRTVLFYYFGHFFKFLRTSYRNCF